MNAEDGFYILESTGVDHHWCATWNPFFVGLKEDAYRAVESVTKVSGEQGNTHCNGGVGIMSTQVCDSGCFGCVVHTFGILHRQCVQVSPIGHSGSRFLSGDFYPGPSVCGFVNLETGTLENASYKLSGLYFFEAYLGVLVDVSSALLQEALEFFRLAEEGVAAEGGGRKEGGGYRMVVHEAPCLV